MSLSESQKKHMPAPLKACLHMRIFSHIFQSSSHMPGGTDALNSTAVYICMLNDSHFTCTIQV